MSKPKPETIIRNRAADIVAQVALLDSLLMPHRRRDFADPGIAWMRGPLDMLLIYAKGMAAGFDAAIAVIESHTARKKT